MVMKCKRFALLMLLLLLCALLCGCGAKKTDPPVQMQLSENWEGIIAGITPEKLALCGWYADPAELRAEAMELNSITFSNYDPTRSGAFLEVPYQCSISYSGLLPGSTGSAPVYSVFLSDNTSDRYYACDFDKDFQPVTEEGEWFLGEEKEAFLRRTLENCRELIFADEGGV